MRSDEAAAPGTRPRRNRGVVALAGVLAFALVIALVTLLVAWDHSRQLAADLDQARSELEEVEREKEEAVESAYDEGYADGRAALAAEAELNPTAKAAMETAWAAMNDGVRDSVCLGLDWGVVEAARVLHRLADRVPGVTADQLEAFFREECDASA